MGKGGEFLMLANNIMPNEEKEGSKQKRRQQFPDYGGGPKGEGEGGTGHSREGTTVLGGGRTKERRKGQGGESRLREGTILRKNGKGGQAAGWSCD